jgi:hypothetical protein
MIVIAGRIQIAKLGLTNVATSETTKPTPICPQLDSLFLKTLQAYMNWRIAKGFKKIIVGLW